jgi:hypothetical protein
MNQAVNLEKRVGRPAGSRTRFPGLTEFAKAHGYGVVYAHEVLKGRRPSAPLRRAWLTWKAAQAAGR